MNTLLKTSMIHLFLTATLTGVIEQKFALAGFVEETLESQNTTTSYYTLIPVDADGDIDMGTASDFSTTIPLSLPELPLSLFIEDEEWPASDSPSSAAHSAMEDDDEGDEDEDDEDEDDNSTVYSDDEDYHHADWDKDLAETDYYDNWGKVFPLHSAAYLGWDEGIIRLVESGRRIERTDWSDCQPLHLAAQNGKPSTVTLLLSYGAKLNEKEFRRNTPLHLTADNPFHWRTDTLRILLEAGANPDIKNEDGDTPLHVACKAGVLQSVQYIIQYGADTNVRNKKGLLPVEVAEKKGKTEVASFLRSL